MRYSYEFKKMCVEMYRKGQYPETPSGIKASSFRSKIREWDRLEAIHGWEGLRPKNMNRKWTPEQRYELVAMVLAGKSLREVAYPNGLSDSILYQWVRKYKTLGYNGLVDSKKGRPRKELQMEKKISPEPLTESEREELIRLRTETEYLRTELAVTKKLIALRQEKEAARLKAKKQQSSEIYANKDTN